MERIIMLVETEVRGEYLARLARGYLRIRVISFPQIGEFDGFDGPEAWFCPRRRREPDSILVRNSYYDVEVLLRT